MLVKLNFQMVKKVMNNVFHGILVGTNNEKYYAIYNLKKPLFGGN